MRSRFFIEFNCGFTALKCAYNFSTSVSAIVKGWLYVLPDRNFQASNRPLDAVYPGAGLLMKENNSLDTVPANAMRPENASVKFEVHRCHNSA